MPTTSPPAVHRYGIAPAADGHLHRARGAGGHALEHRARRPERSGRRRSVQCCRPRSLPPGLPAGSRMRSRSRCARRKPTPPKLVEYRLFFSDYRKVDGMSLPHRIARGVGRKTTEEWDVKSYKVNPLLQGRSLQGGELASCDDGWFRFSRWRSSRWAAPADGATRSRTPASASPSPIRTGAVIVRAKVTVVPTEPPWRRPIEIGDRRAGRCRLDGARAGPLLDPRRVPGLRPAAARRCPAAYRIEHRREMKLDLARVAEDVTVGQDRARARDRPARQRVRQRADARADRRAARRSGRNGRGAQGHGAGRAR